MSNSLPRALRADVGWVEPREATRTRRGLTSFEPTYALRGENTMHSPRRGEKAIFHFFEVPRDFFGI